MEDCSTEYSGMEAEVQDDSYPSTRMMISLGLDDNKALAAKAGCCNALLDLEGQWHHASWVLYSYFATLTKIGSSDSYVTGHAPYIETHCHGLDCWG